jgi:hypothetical protein
MRGSEEEAGGDDLQLGHGGDGEDIDEAEEEVLDEGADDAEGAEDGADQERGPAAADDEEEGQARRDVARHRRPSQTERRALREARELRERLDRLERERSQPAPIDPQAQQREEQAFWESLQYMDQGQQLRAVRDRERGLYVQGLNQVRGETLDAIDRTRFETRAENSPARRRLSSEVERHIADLRRAGNYNATRDQVFHLLLGMEVDQKANVAGPRQRAQARARVERETTRPGSSRGDVVREGRSRVDADEAFLRRTRVGDVI